MSVTTKLDLLSSEEAADVECSVAFAWDLLHTLQRVINSKLDLKHVDLPKYFSQVVPRLFGLVIPASLSHTDSAKSVFRDRRLSSIVGDIAETLFWELTPE